MPIPTLITDLSTTAAFNYPAGSDSPSVLDDVQRAHAAFIAQLRDGANINAAPVKPTLADADEFGVTDSANSFGLVKLTGAALRSNVSNALSVYTATTGTANAIVLTTSPTSVAPVVLQVGSQVRFRAATANSGAATINWGGTGVKSCRTITGVALPSGYIRTDVDTVATYDGTYFVVQREIESGTNANGTYTRWADGTQICRFLRISGGVASDFVAGSIFLTSIPITMTLPAAFIDVPAVSDASRFTRPDGVSAFSSRGWGHVANATNTTVSMLVFGYASDCGMFLGYVAVGRWY